MMDKYTPNMEKHCYFNDPRYPCAICYDFKHPHYCHRFKKDLNIEKIVDEREDGIGHFKGQVHRFPLKLNRCKLTVW